MSIEVTYLVTDLSDGFRQYERTFSVPNYRTLRSLLSAIDAACMDIEADKVAQDLSQEVTTLKRANSK